MLNRFHRAFRSPIKFYLRLRLLFAPVYLLRLKLQAWLYGGQVEIGRSVRINHPTQFQGSGILRLDSQVILGFHLAGSSESVISGSIVVRNSMKVIGSVHDRDY